MKTYTITLEGVHHCKPNVCYERIYGISGLLEEVIFGLVTFHSVKQHDINKVLDYIAQRFGNCLVTIEAETYYRCYCNLKFIIAAELK